MPNTNSWLCIYAIAQLGKPYRLGASGDFEECNKGKVCQNGWYATSEKNAYPNPYNGKSVKTHDCSGLVKGALCCDAVDEGKVRKNVTFAKSGAEFHSATSQYWNYCSQRGTSLSDFPRIPGMLLFKNKDKSGHTKQHMGIYIGKFVDLNGEPHEDFVIDAMGSKWGVVMGPLYKKDGTSRWSCWGQLTDCEIDTSAESLFDAKSNSMIHGAPEDTTVDIQPITIATENMKPFVATVLGQYDPKLNYDKIKEARISAMMLYGGELFDVSHVKHTYINPALANQVAQCNASGLPYAMYVNVRARNEIEADAECKALYYVISQYPPKLGIWLSLNIGDNVEMNNKIIDIYYKFIYKWGLADRCGLYVTSSQLKKITWENYEEVFYLWYIDPKDVNEVDDELLDPTMFDLDPENSVSIQVELHDTVTPESEQPRIQDQHGISAETKSHDWLPNFPRKENGRFVRIKPNREFVAQAKLEERGLSPLYDSQTDRHDMTLRQVGYLDTSYSLSNNSSNIAISVINYTTALGDLYDQFAPAVATLNSVKVDTSQLESDTKICIDFFIEKGYSAASASGIAACLQLYSGISTDYSKTIGTSYVYGIGAWDEVKMNSMKNKVGSGWKTDLTGQLEYLLYDIETSFSAMVIPLKLQQLNKENAQVVAEVFLTVYNELYMSDSNIEKVKSYAGEIYDKLIITGIKNQSPSVVGTVHAEVFDINGNILDAKFGVPIPPELDQTGLLYGSDYTSYTHWFYNWGKSTDSYRLSRVWESQGCPHDKGVATIGGYYCVAVKPKFGNVGDVIAVLLEKGDIFCCIIADIKGDDALSEWGHSKSDDDNNEFNDISIIEWERVKTDSQGKAIKATIGSTNVDKSSKGATIGEWEHQKILNITNYGSYCDL